MAGLAAGIDRGAQQSVWGRNVSPRVPGPPKGSSAHASGPRKWRGIGSHARAAVVASASGRAIDEADLAHLTRAAAAAVASVGATAPHPNAGCVLVAADGRPLAEAHLYAQGTRAPEVAAAAAAGSAAAGGTAYLNLESGDCPGDGAAVAALLGARVARVVVGLRHPLPAARGAAIAALRAAGVEVSVLGEARLAAPPAAAAAAYAAVLAANEPLLHRAVLRRPLGLLKYAMTLDGKIAASTGHSAWVSSPESRARVFAARAASDAVLVGGCTARRDNPRLTTRREGGHAPARVVLSRTLDLPGSLALWDPATGGPTIVATQRGARRDFQAQLRDAGVEVVEFDFLTPDAVAAYCFGRGFLQCLWECGGTLAAPAIAGGAIHKALAFVAPKIVGGARAPTPVGDLGFVEMTQALAVTGVAWEQVGPDLMMSGYLPASGGPAALAAAAAAAAGEPPLEGLGPGAGVALPGGGAGAAAGSSGAAAPLPGSGGGDAEFYKAWDALGCLSNFSPHAVAMPDGPMTAGRAAEVEARRAGGGTNGSSGGGAALTTWATVEHYYQAQKFAGVAGAEAAALVAAIAAAAAPEQAAALGRRAERATPALVRPDWADAKPAAMLAALRAKFRGHAGPRAALLATLRRGEGGPPAALVETSPHDFFWGRGHDGRGANTLGRLLMQVRGELAAEEGGGGEGAAGAAAAARAAAAR